MRIGFGATRWLSSLYKKKLDGIDIYTQELWRVFYKEKNMTLFPLVFGKNPKVDVAPSLNNIFRTSLNFPTHTVLHTNLKIPSKELNEYQNKIDLFFAPDHHIPWMKNVPVIATVMDIIPIIHPEWASSRFRRLKNFLFKRTILSADHIITVSQYSKDDIIQYLGVSPEKISVVDLGVNKRFFYKVTDHEKKNVLDKYSLIADFFLFIGTLQPRKNILRIIEAHRRLPEEVKKKHPLVIVGQYGWGSQKLMEEIDIMQKHNDGVWLSYVAQEDLYALLQLAIGMVYPSLYEGFGLPVIEGFASKCPVITSNITSLPEVAGDAALRVDPYSTKEITDAMNQLVHNKVLRETLIARGNERVKKYNWDKVADDHLIIFKKVLQS